MKLAIMQPYFLPYIGYFQLIEAVDIFVFDEQLQYIEQGWVNRNRYLFEGRDLFLIIPLKKGSYSFSINERYIADNFNRVKLINKLNNAYRKAPYFYETMELFTKIVNCEERNLADYIYYSMVEICTHLGITTRIVRSIKIDIDRSLKSYNRIVAVCRAYDAKTYINPIGGVKLYSKEWFAEKRIELKFIQPKPITYKQFDNEFVPWLSIIDILMFNPIEKVRLILQEYELV